MKIGIYKKSVDHEVFIHTVKHAIAPHLQYGNIETLNCIIIVEL